VRRNLKRHGRVLSMDMQLVESLRKDRIDIFQGLT
jgi:hypothetical protein